MSRAPIMFLVCVASGLAPSWAQAGVTVEYGNPDRFTDAGDRNSDPVKVMKELADYMTAAGNKIVPPGTDVRIEVLDLDRAGRPRMNLPTEIRVMTGRSDPPCMDLRYTVTTGGQASAPRTERVCDTDYLRTLEPRYFQNDALVYEKRMATTWLEQRFGAKR